MDIVRRLRLLFSFAVGTALIGSISFALNAKAAEGEFYLQVSPSPLVATLKPGQQSTLDVKVRNAGPQAEELKIEPRSFKINNDGRVELDDTQAPDIADWLRFSAPTFKVEPGQTYEQKITVNVPKDAGFSYSFALMITRQQHQSPMIDRGQELKGQVAIFALLNIDKPGAVRQLQLEQISSEAPIYEYLPATIHIRLKNTGNTIVQPSGNVFMQRQPNDSQPIDTLAVNNTGGYILPNTVRTLTAQWVNGFPATKQDGEQNEYLDWNWSKLADFRIGYYTAKTVVVYNDGQRDVPIMADVGFWVFPWKILLGALLLVALLLFGVWSLVRTVLSRKNKSSVYFRKK